MVSYLTIHVTRDSSSSEERNKRFRTRNTNEIRKNCAAKRIAPQTNLFRSPDGVR